MPRKILHIVANLPPEGSDEAEFAAKLAQAQKNAGNDVVIAAIADDNIAVSAFEAEESGVRIARFAPTGAPRRHFSRTMLACLRKAVKEADIVHVHGVDTFPIRLGGLLAIMAKKRLIVSPHGCLLPSGNGSGKNEPSVIYRFIIGHAALVHAFSESEAKAIEAAVRSAAGKVSVVPYGIELPRLMPKPHAHDVRTLLFFGAACDFSVIEMLLDAISRCDARKRFRLIVCGTSGDDAVSGLKAQAARLGISDRIDFREPASGIEKWRMFREADCLVHAGRSTSFGMDVVEALACGIPVICTRCASWEVLAAEHCGWWCDASAEGIAIAIRDMLYHYDEELVEMGNNAKRLVARGFTWENAAKTLTV